MPASYYPPPQWIYNTLSSTSTSYQPMTYTTTGQYYYTSPPYGGTAFQPPPARDISFDPSPAVPARPKTDMDWLREQVDSVCALAGL